MTRATTIVNATPREGGGRMAIAACAALVASIALSLFGASALDWARGYAIYHGHLAVTGRLDGHAFDLPPIALRCAGCHDAGAQLTRSLELKRLTDMRSRRGGPATAYSLESFCKVVGSGLDPAFVMVDRTMPRFDLTAGECRALWTFLRLR